jgi:hypothetical protein
MLRHALNFVEHPVAPVQNKVINLYFVQVPRGIGGLGVTLNSRSKLGYGMQIYVNFFRYLCKFFGTPGVKKTPPTSVRVGGNLPLPSRAYGHGMLQGV